MKQIITLFAAALLSSHSSAQFVMLHDTQGNMVNNQTVVHWGSVSDALMTVHLETILVNGPQRPVNMRRYEMGVFGVSVTACCAAALHSGISPAS